MEEPFILVKSATKKGFEEAYIGDCIAGFTISDYIAEREDNK